MQPLYTYSGRVSFPGGAPTLTDIAVQLMREGRYAGAGMRWWPVGLHSFVVSDLLPMRLKFYGLVHDASETITGDVPSPVKTKEIRRFEDALMRDIYKSFGVPAPTPAQHKVIKKADRAALCGEVWAGVGTQALQDVYPRAPKAEVAVIKYVNMYTYPDCLEVGGKAVIEFIRRFRLYKGMLAL